VAGMPMVRAAAGGMAVSLPGALQMALPTAPLASMRGP